MSGPITVACCSASPRPGSRSRNRRSFRRGSGSSRCSRAAQLANCEWCLDFGSRLAQEAGIPADDLRELSHWRTSTRFDELDRLVLEYAEGMTRTPVEVYDELFARLREHFDERQIVHLTIAVAMENLYNRSNHALGIESQGFSDGIYCVVPDGSANLGGDAARQIESVGRRS